MTLVLSFLSSSLLVTKYIKYTKIEIQPTNVKLNNINCQKHSTDFTIPAIEETNAIKEPNTPNN